MRSTPGGGKMRGAGQSTTAFLGHNACTSANVMLSTMLDPENRPYPDSILNPKTQTACCADQGITLPDTNPRGNADLNQGPPRRNCLLAPPGALASAWSKKFRTQETLSPAGWMACGVTVDAVRAIAGFYHRVGIMSSTQMSTVLSGGSRRTRQKIYRACHTMVIRCLQPLSGDKWLACANGGALPSSKANTLDKGRERMKRFACPVNRQCDPKAPRTRSKWPL